MSLVSTLGHWIPRPIRPMVKRWLGLSVPGTFGDVEAFLDDARGVIHIGANVGQERERYRAHGVAVVWVEPIPEVYATLVENISNFPGQRAFRYLVTDVDDREYQLNIASNRDAQSSSILDFALHRALWPSIGWAGSLSISSITLPTLIAREGLEIAHYDALVLDTQGSELLVLRGAESLLPAFRYIQVEVADFEAYAGGAQIGDMRAFMSAHGFREIAWRRFAGERGVGNYYDMLYARS